MQKRIPETKRAAGLSHLNISNCSHRNGRSRIGPIDQSQKKTKFREDKQGGEAQRSAGILMVRAMIKIKFQYFYLRISFTPLKRINPKLLEVILLAKEM